MSGGSLGTLTDSVSVPEVPFGPVAVICAVPCVFAALVLQLGPLHVCAAFWASNGVDVADGEPAGRCVALSV